jgi:SAM-dependent methyltransferase
MFGFTKTRRLRAQLDESQVKVRKMEKLLAEARAEKVEVKQRHQADLHRARLHEGNAAALAELFRRELEISEARPVTLPAGAPPLPPVALRLRVGNDLAAHSFLEFGRTRAAEVTALLASTGRPLASFASVADFGCGCGRVLRHLPDLLPSTQFTGLDIDPEAIQWCQAHLPAGHRFHVVKDLPPSPLPQGEHDAVLALSVFTHLPLAHEQAWLAELVRITHPGGLLLLSFLDEEIMLREGFRPEQALENEDGFYYFQGSVTEGLPGYYKSTYHTEAAVRRLWSADLDILEIRPQVLNGRQSVAICQPRAAGA